MKIKLSLLLIILSISLTSCIGNNNNPLADYDFSQMDLVQLREPEEGQPMAIIDTTYGEITVVFYPEYTPNYVDNFIKMAKDGFYDGKSIFGVQPDVFFLSGAVEDEDAEQVWKTATGEKIDHEYNVNLWPFKGALMAYSDNAGYSQGDSRFFICNYVKLSEEEIETLEGNVDKDGNKIIPQELIDVFINDGGVMGFSGRYPVYGQTIKGFDVIDKITSAEIKDKDSLEPKEEIIINKVTITEYKKDGNSNEE